MGGLKMKNFPERIQGEGRYVEKDEDGYFHIFGEKSGHSYGSYPTKEEAERHLYLTYLE
jgi:hypothetical protein